MPPPLCKGRFSLCYDILERCCQLDSQYRKIPIISPGLIVVQKAFLLGIFLGELIFGWACYRREFCVQNGFGLSIKTAKNTKITT